MGMRWIWAGVALTGLGGCADNAVDDVLTFEEMTEDSVAAAERVAEMPVARGDDMPVTGSAALEGHAVIGL